MKLALIGTHGVGKTTLAYEICSLLKKSGYNVELVTEVARQSPFPVNAATTLEGQLWILHAQIVAELDAARRAPHVICDRAVLDNYCYLVNKFGRQPHLEPWLAWWMNSYSFLVGVPPVAFEIPSDGFRSEDRAFQQRIHDLLNELLAAPPFDNLRASILWLEPSERRFWAKRIFAAALPLLPRRHCAIISERPSMDPHEILRTLQAAVDSGEIRREETLEHAAKKLDKLRILDSLDMVELSMALQETGIVVGTVGELIRLLESGFDGTVL
jgi:AAA domain